MTIYNGTNGNDVLTGTAASDTFNPGLGQDTVSGGAGTDTLNVDYTGVYPSRATDIVTYGGGAFSGSVNADYNAVNFDGIQVLDVRHNPDAVDGAIVDLTLDTPLDSRSALNLGGKATLVLTLGDFDAQLSQAADGTLTSNLGALGLASDVDLVRVELGLGHNTVNLPDGVVGSHGGTDTIEAARIWNGDYGDSDNASLLYDGDKQSGSATGGTSLANIGSLTFIGGAVSSHVNLKDVSFSAVGGSAANTNTVIKVDLSGLAETGRHLSTLASQPDGSFSGQFYADVSGQTYYFNHFGQVTATLSAADDQVSVDAAALMQGGTLNLDGGAGDDLLILDLTATNLASLNYYADDGSARLGIGATRSVFHFERYDVDFGPGNDRAGGGAGNDTLDGGSGIDTLAGGAGNDTYRVQTYRDVVIEGVNQGTDTIESVVNYTLPDNVENLSLSGIATYGKGNAFGNVIRDLVTSPTAPVTLDGQGGGDTLIGGKGVDILIGGAGRDMLTGGAGADHFVFRPGDTGSTFALADMILDFSHSDGDKIDLSAIDAIQGGADDPFTFIGSAAFSGHAGELRVATTSDPRTSLLEGDTNGDGTIDVMIAVTGSIPIVSDIIV